jgi:hypothetical protein
MPEWRIAEPNPRVTAQPGEAEGHRLAAHAPAQAQKRLRVTPVGRIAPRIGRIMRAPDEEPRMRAACPMTSDR